MFCKRYDIRTQAMQEELNLTPFLDVMIVLIPFLMLSASFASVVVLPVGLPTPVASPDKALVPPPFDLVAQASPDSIKIWLNPASDKPETVATIATPGDAAYSRAILDSFHKALVDVKRKNPTQRRLALDAAPGLSIERMSQLMDIAESLMPGEVVEGRPETDRSLFPDVALKGVYVP